jgi:hypothetical protein
MKTLYFLIKLILTVSISVTLVYFWLLNGSYNPSAGIVYIYSIPFMFVVFLFVSIIVRFLKREWFYPSLINSFITPIIFLFLLNAKANAYIENNYLDFIVNTKEGDFRITIYLKNKEMIHNGEFNILKKERNSNSGYDEGTYKLKGDTIFLFGDKIYRIAQNSMKIYDFPMTNDIYKLNRLEYE